MLSATNRTYVIQISCVKCLLNKFPANLTTFVVIIMFICQKKLHFFTFICQKKLIFLKSAMKINCKNNKIFFSNCTKRLFKLLTVIRSS